MKTYTIVLAWGDPEEGNYHWAGQAENEDAAVQIAREEMDVSYNEEFKIDAALQRGQGETTEYDVVDVMEGVNQYAALVMLSALRELRDYLATSCAIHELPLASMLVRANAAIAAGEGGPEGK